MCTSKVWYEYTFDTSSVYRPAFSWDCDVPRLSFLGRDDYELYLADLLHWPQDGVTVQVSSCLFGVNEVKVKKKKSDIMSSLKEHKVLLWWTLQLRRYLFYCSTWISPCWLLHTGSTQIHIIPTGYEHSWYARTSSLFVHSLLVLCYFQKWLENELWSNTYPTRCTQI